MRESWRWFGPNDPVTISEIRQTGAKDEVDTEFRCHPSVISDDGKGNSLSLLIGPENTPCFTVKRAMVSNHTSRKGTTFFLGVVTAGSGEIRICDEVTQLNQWDRFFCPVEVGNFEYVCHSDTPLSILECYPGNTK